MSENVEINGDVMQAIMGDLHEAPRLSNVVNLNLSEKKEIAFITDYQRRRINALVKELAALTDDDHMTIYKIIIADFGLMKIKELPIERYSEVKTLLEKWIGAAKEIKAPSPTTPASECKPHSVEQQAPCLACAEKELNYGRLQRTSRAQVLGLVALAALCGWLLYKLPNDIDAGTARSENVCYLDGKAHSVGSRIKTYAGTIEECVPATSNTPAMWTLLKRGR